MYQSSFSSCFEICFLEEIGPMCLAVRNVLEDDGSFRGRIDYGKRPGRQR